MALGERLPASTTGLYLKLNGNANDSSANGNNGTINGATLIAGRLGSGAYSFDGNDYGSITNAASLRPTTFTFAVNFYHSTTTGAHTIFESYSQNPNVAGFRFGINVDTAAGTVNKLSILVGDNTGTTGSADYNTYYIGSSFNDGLWHRAVFQYDGTSAAKIYIDGVLQAGQWLYTYNTINIAFATTSYVNIGREFSPTAGKYWAGGLDEMILDPFIWTAEQVKKDYTQQKGRFAIL